MKRKRRLVPKSTRFKERNNPCKSVRKKILFRDHSSLTKRFEQQFKSFFLVKRFVSMSHTRITWKRASSNIHAASARVCYLAHKKCYGHAASIIQDNLSRNFISHYSNNKYQVIMFDSFEERFAMLFWLTFVNRPNNGPSVPQSRIRQCKWTKETAPIIY